MKRYLFLPVAALTVIAACNQKEEDFNKEPVSNPVIETVKMQFRAATEDSPSKTTLDSGTGTVAWAAGDAVKFVYELDKTPGYITSDALAAEDIDGEGVATFTASVPAAFAMTEEEYQAGGGSSLHLYAVSPASTVIDYDTASSFFLTVPTVQDGSFANASIALAKWDKTNPSGTLEFKNLCGLLKFTIADDAVRKVILHSDDYIAGKMDISFTGPAVKNVSSGEKAITVNVPGAGTYYIAVLPTNEEKGIGINNIYVELLDESDNLIGDKGSANPLVIARKQIRSIGTLATGLSDRLYFKADGTGSGSSWDDAGGVSLLKSTMKSASVVTKNLYLAAGTYTVSEAIAPAAGTTLRLYGGYPSSATGKSLAGRDIANNATRFHNPGGRNFWTQKGNWVYDGLYFSCESYTGTAGGASLLILAGTESAVLNNCTFDNTSVSTANSGVVRVAVTATFKNCNFSNNSTAGSGGALWVVNTGTVNLSNCSFSSNSANHGGAINVAGTLIANNCTFTENTAKQHGGAIVTSGGSVRLNQCVFTDNQSSGGSKERQAADLYIGGTTSVFLNDCYLGQSSTGFVPAVDSPHRILTGANTTIGLNNCVISGPYGQSNSVVDIRGNSVVVNTTIYAQAGGACIISGATDADGCRSINNIVINGSSGKSAFQANDARYIQLYNTIYSATIVSGTGSFDINSSISDKYYGVFPDNDAWAQKYLGTAATLPDGGAIKAYVWDGVCDGFTKTTLADIKTLISGTTNVGTSFLEWLESEDLKVNGKEALAVDIRGAARNTSAMWPGSYEQASGVASAPAFTLK